MARRLRVDAEDEVRIRPNPRGSRPRTKQRPGHSDARRGTVLVVDRGRYDILIDDGPHVRAMKAKELGRAPIVVGDRVDVVGDTSGTAGTLARAVRVHPRSATLRRSADDGEDAAERVLVANADQLVIVTALADPQPRPRMIDRCLVAAYDAGMTPILCLTKADLADADADVFAERYATLDIAAFATVIRPGHIEGLPDLLTALSGHTSVLIGHSGVGKSTLVNALVPDADRSTGSVNEVTGRGRHTSSSAIALPLPQGGWVIDTPGVRGFGLAHIEPDDLLKGFDDLAQIARDCPRGCHHGDDAPDCALDAWAGADSTSDDARARLASFRRLLASRSEDVGHGA
ncbi:MAG: ribosome small subunit-dependent GTPase A [Beutenbergiaceae bacterium]